jgi:ABC-type thiamine transport system substrate-binding protein
MMLGLPVLKRLLPWRLIFAAGSDHKFYAEGNLTDEASIKFLKGWFESYIAFLNGKI